MRKAKRNNKLKITLYIILTFMLLTMGIAYSLLQQKLNLIGKANIRPAEDTGDYIVTYVINNKWYTNNKYYYQITMTLFNNTNSLLNGWTIDISTPDNAEIINYSNVNCKLKGKRIEFTNVSYNSQVISKESVSFEFQISTTDPYYNPSNIIVNGNEQEEIPSLPEGERKINIELIQENSWESGGYYMQYALNITNTGTEIISSWQFDLEAKKQYGIEQIWNAESKQKEDILYTIKNLEYNGIIQPNETISIGIIIKSSIKNNLFATINVKLE